MPDRIAITEKSELARFGLEADRFIKKAHDKIGGYEFHGPCPKGCGRRQLVVSNGGYWCRTCNWKGWLANLNPIEFSPAEREAARLREERQAAEDERRHREAVTKLNIRPLLYETFHRNLHTHPDLLKELEDDGIPYRAVKHFKIGFNPGFRFHLDGEAMLAGALTFPIFDKSQCVNIRHRILLPGEVIGNNKYRPIFCALGASYLDATFPGTEYVAIVEGEKKAICLWANGISAIAVPGIWTWKQEWLDEWRKRFGKFFVIFDNDGADARKASRALCQRLYPAFARELNLGGKPDDLMVSGWVTAESIIRRMNQLKEMR